MNLPWREADQHPRGALMSDFISELSIRPMGHGVALARLGHDLLDDYLRFVAARCRPNSVLAAGMT